MGSKSPRRFETAEQRVPVRLTVFASGTPHDWQNEVTSRWLRQRRGRRLPSQAGSQLLGPARSPHPATVYDAAALLLACPHLRLHKHIYEGPER